MTNDNQPRYRASIHIQLYLWVALLAVSVIPALLISGVLFDTTRFVEGLTTFAFLIAGFQWIFWYARRRCSSEDLPVWVGLLYITSYMTMGVSSISLFIAVPCAMVAVLGATAIAVLSIGDADSTRAQQRFRSMVIWFSRHRMYQ